MGKRRKGRREGRREGRGGEEGNRGRAGGRWVGARKSEEGKRRGGWRARTGFQKSSPGPLGFNFILWPNLSPDIKQVIST